MILRRAWLLALTLSLAAASPARAEVARPVHETRLANGLRLVVAPDPAGTDASVLVRYDTGSRDEPGGLEGLAHLVEHVMFLGSSHVEPGAFARLLEQAGATNLNGTTDMDSTTYFETVPPERLELALWLESDRMGYGLARLDDPTLARARAEVQNERRDRVVDRAFGEVPAILHAQLFPAWHPYHHLPIGRPASIEHASTADVRAFVRTWYGPANATVVVAGKVDPAAVKALVERYFGSLPANAPPVRPAMPAAETASSVTVRVEANALRSEIHLAWATPRFGAPGDVELDLAAGLLVDRGAGWLERRLLAEPRLCVAVSAAQSSRALVSVFEIHAVVAEGRSVSEAFAGIVAALKRFDGEVSDDEIERARRLFQRGKLFGMESSLGLGRELAGLSRLGPLPASYDGRHGLYASITTGAVRSAVHTWLGAAPWVAVLGVPERGRPAAGEVASSQEVPR